MSESRLQNIQMIRQRVDELIERYRETEAKKEAAENRSNQLAATVKELSDENSQLKEQIKMLKLAENIELSNSDERSDLKKQIDHYIREIDKCIAQLNS